MKRIYVGEFSGGEIYIDKFFEKYTKLARGNFNVCFCELGKIRNDSLYGIFFYKKYKNKELCSWKICFHILLVPPENCITHSNMILSITFWRFEMQQLLR